jgi:hypothetical protein
MTVRSVACSWICAPVAFHDGWMAISVIALVELYYEELWNRWNDAAVEGTLRLMDFCRSSEAPRIA